MNWTIYKKKKRVRVCPHVPKPNLICQKTGKSFLSLSFSFFALIIDELWLNRRLASRTSRGKKWMVLTQLVWERKQHSSRVLHMNQCIIIIQREREKDSLFEISFYNWTITYLCVSIFKKRQFLFWESFSTLSVTKFSFLFVVSFTERKNNDE